MPGGIGATIGQAGLPDAIPFWFGEDQARYLIAAPFAEAEKIVAEARAAYHHRGRTGQDRRRRPHAGRQGQRDAGAAAATAMKAGSPASWRAKKFRSRTKKVDAMGMKASEIENLHQGRLPRRRGRDEGPGGRRQSLGRHGQILRLQGQNPRGAAPDGLCRAQGQYGRRAACPAAAPPAPRTRTNRPSPSCGRRGILLVAPRRRIASRKPGCVAKRQRSCRAWLPAAA